MGRALELSKMEYISFWDWFIAFKDPREIWEDMPSFLIAELVSYFGLVAICLHAFSRGERWPFLILAAIGHGLFTEYLSYVIPDIDSFWHAQSMIMLLGRRLPFHIVFIYVIFYYHASWAVSKLKLKCQYAEHLATALLVVLVDVPFDIVCIKFMHWTWHDTDPNIYDRNFWVPWTSYLFHLSFSFSWSLAFHKTRRVFEKRDLEKWQRGNLMSEIFAVLMASVLGMPGGCLLLVPGYHILHDVMGIHSETIAIPLLLCSLAMVWKFDRKSNRYEWPERNKSFAEKLLFFHLALHYAIYILFATFFNPESHKSVGIHEPVGNCESTLPVQTLLKTLSKKEFLCTTDYDEKYFNFNCATVPKEGSIWYTICGTAFDNRAEYVWMSFIIALGAFLIFRAIHFDYDGKLLKVLHPQRGKKKTN